MKLEIDTRLLDQVDLMDELGQATLAATEAVVNQQFRFARGVVARSGERLHDILSGTSDPWSAAVRAGLQETAEAAREGSRLTALLQLQAMRLVERQTRQAQAILAAAESLLAAALPGPAAAGVPTDREVLPAGRRLVAAGEPEQRLAA